MDSKCVYVVAVDVLDPAVDTDALRELLKSSPVILGWWNHIPGCFLVSTSSSANELTNELRKATHDARLLVVEVKPANSEGWLPERSWQWIRRREQESAR